MSGGAPVIVRAYRGLLRVLPRSFRRRFGDEMVQSFTAEWRASRQTRSRTGDLFFLARTVVQTLVLAAEERWQALRDAGQGRVSNLTADLRIAVRTLFREPGFTTTAVLALGLGIGLTASAFSIVHGTVLRGLPFEAPHELVHFARGDDERSSLPVVPHDLVEWRSANRTFVDLAAYTEAVVNLTDGSQGAERVYGASIEPRAFTLLGVEAALGRSLSEADDEPGGEPVVLLSHSLWQRRLAGDPEAVGQSLRINAVPHTVVGVMPEGFGFPLSEELWLPLRLDLTTTVRGEGRLDVFGRLRPGVDLETARAEFAGISERLAGAYPDSNGGVRAVLRAYADEYVDEEFGQMVLALLAAAAFVLLLAVAHVASLMLVRGARRAREVAVRVSLGAGRGRIVQHLLAETAVLGAAAAALGVTLAWLGIGWFSGRGARPGTFQLAHGDAVPFWWDVRLDPTVLGFVLAVTVGTVLVTGLLPAARVLGTEPRRLLQDESRGGTRRTSRFAAAAVVAEIAMAAGVLTVSGLMARSVAALGTVGRTLDTQGVTVGAVGLPDARLGADEAAFPSMEARRLFWDRVRSELLQDPAVDAVSINTAVPFLRVGRQRVSIPGLDQAEELEVATGYVDPEWFGILGVDALEGRLLTEDDRLGGEAVVVVNSSFAAHWLDGAALGRSVEVVAEDGTLTPARIVGVVPDLWMDGIGGEEPAGLYRPFAQAGAVNRDGVFDRRELRYARVMVRGKGGHPVARPLQEAVSRLAPGLPVYGSTTLDETLARVGGQYRLYGGYYLVFGLVALFMVILGLHGLVAYTVGQREREIGIRVALGADRSGVVTMVLRRALVLVGLGLAGGLLFALWLRDSLSLVLYRVEASDPWTLAAVFLVLLVTTASASALPAFRAGRVDPVEAMRR